MPLTTPRHSQGSVCGDLMCKKRRGRIPSFVHLLSRSHLRGCLSCYIIYLIFLRIQSIVSAITKSQGSLICPGAALCGTFCSNTAQRRVMLFAFCNNSQTRKNCVDTPYELLLKIEKCIHYLSIPTP